MPLFSQLSIQKNSSYWRLKGVCCVKFCLDGEVVFIHSKQVDKKCLNNLILISTKVTFEEYLGRVIKSENPKFATSDSKSRCTRTVFP